MKLDQIRAFVYTADYQSMVKAGAKLSKSRSAMSQAIAHLETDLGLELFKRSRNDLSLTDAGSALLPYARNLLQVEADFIHKVEGALRQEEFFFPIAVENTLPFSQSAELLKEITQRFPATRIKWLSPGAGDLVSIVSESIASVGLGVSRSHVPENCLTYAVGTMNFACVASPGHPLNQITAEPSQRELNHFQAVINSGRQAITEEMLMLGATKMIEVESYQGVKELVCRAVGWGVLPRHMVRQELNKGTLFEFKPPFGGQDNNVKIDIIWNKTCSDSPVTRWVIQHIKKYWNNI